MVSPANTYTVSKMVFRYFTSYLQDLDHARTRIYRPKKLNNVFCIGLLGLVLCE